jgi:PIN domain nuclease of toxin-antitoxin system
MMAEAVLDASAVLALLRREPGYERVQAVLPYSLISAVNLAEVVGKLIQRGADPEGAAEAVEVLPFEVVPLDESLAIRAGALWSETRAGGLSLGNRACVALAQAEGLPAYTTDRSWSKIATNVEVHLIR